MSAAASILSGSASFLPHGVCISWSPVLLAGFVISDLLIATAYFSIPVVLVVLARKRADLPFRELILLFSAFVVACGMTHVFDVINLWYPMYDLTAVAKIVTALISILTAALLWQMLPKALALPSHQTLAATNLQLAEEIRQRKHVEASLQSYQLELERLVGARTSSLREANHRLEREKIERDRLLTELHASEALAQARADELSHLMNIIPVAVWTCKDASATHITGNRLADEWLQVHTGTNVSKSATEDCASDYRVTRDGVEVPVDDLPVQRAVRGEAVQDVDLEIELSDGSRRRILCNAAPVLDGGGIPKGAVMACMDVTELYRVEAERQEAREAAEHANRAKSRFLAAASHDLRQPLSAISIYVSSLKPHVAAEGQMMLSSMKDCISSLSELLTDLLDLSKLEAGVVRPNVRTFALDDVMAPLLAAHEPEALIKGLRVRRCYPPCLVHTDPVLLRRIVGNYLSNAIRYTERGGVLMGTRRRDGKTWLEVWDTGIGIPEDQIDEIFEEFRQLDDEARTRGSGLGLAIVSRTALLLGLEIRVCSREGRGSLFAIELPLTRGVVPQQPLALPMDEVLYRPLRIALVEDNSAVLAALIHGLQTAGHQVYAATTSGALLQVLSHEQPDVVVADYRLPGGETGFDVITALRDHYREALPAILITGDTDPILVRSMADRGVVVLHKPLDLETLQAYLDDVTLSAQAA